MGRPTRELWTEWRGKANRLVGPSPRLSTTLGVSARVLPGLPPSGSSQVRSSSAQPLHLSSRIPLSRPQSLCYPAAPLAYGPRQDPNRSVADIHPRLPEAGLQMGLQPRKDPPLVFRHCRVVPPEGRTVHPRVGRGPLPLRFGDLDDPSDRPQVGGVPVGQGSPGKKSGKFCQSVPRDERGAPGSRDGEEGLRSSLLDRAFPVAHGRGRDPEKPGDLRLGPSFGKQIEPLKPSPLESGAVAMR